MHRRILLFAAGALLLCGSSRAEQPLSLVVMDPLAAPLSCPCVEGYAQRDYTQLAAHLESTLNRKVRLTFSEALGKALEGDAKGRADLVIGKHSVVLADAKAANVPLTHIAALSGKDGSTVQTGMIVVRSSDPAQSVSDLKDYRIFFGPAECEEKHQAPLALLKASGVAPPAELETSPACSAGATKILELGSEVRAAAVISSYAQPLLQGCGTIKKGDLRVVGTTKPVRFISAFVNTELPETERAEIQSALAAVALKPQLCVKLETLIGFLPPEDPGDAAPPAIDASVEEGASEAPAAKKK